MENEKLFLQFVTFLKTIKDKPLLPEEINLINLIVGHFDQVASSGTAGGKRGKIINDLIQQKAEKTTADKIDFPAEKSLAAAQQLCGFINGKTWSFRKN